MKALPHALIALALFAGGILGGRALSTTAAAGSEEDPAAKTKAPVSGEAKARRTLKFLMARYEANARTPGDLHSALARVDIGTLRSIALEQYTILAAMTKGGKDRQPHQDLYSAAIDELWERRGLSTLEWADGLEHPKERAMMLKSLLRRALKEDPAGALPWMEKYHAEHGKAATIREFTTIALKGAVERGADEVIRVHAMLGSEHATDPFTDVRFPEDFDFGKLHAALDGKIHLGRIIPQWALRDRDAAWAAVRDSINRHGGLSRSNPDSLPLLMKAVVAQDGESKGVQWTVDQLSSLDPMERMNCLLILDRGQKISAEGVAVIVTNLPPEERAAYVSTLLMNGGPPARSFLALDRLSREDLIRVLPRSLFDPDGVGILVREQVQARYHLTPGEISRIVNRGDR